MYKDGIETRLGRYCGISSPGPVQSFRGAEGVKLVFNTDSKGVYSGFKARYVFETAKSIFGDCGGNISNPDEGTGIIQTRNYPKKYEGPPPGMATRTCHWYITVKPNHQILFNFLTFTLEGSPACEYWIGNAKN